MATQKDLDVLKQKLRDLDVKLKSMGGGSAQRDPRFDSAMANQNYANLMRDQQGRIAAERGTPTPPSGPLGGPVGSARSKRDPSKEIILNFAGGEYGIRNDAAANAIAKKYNLEITRNPDPNSALPNYIFKSNGNVNDIISQIKNEPGIGYAEQNFVIPPPSIGGKPQPSQPRLGGPQVGGDFTQGRLMGAPTNRPIPQGGGLGGLTADQAGIPEDQRKILDDLNNPNGYWRGKDQGFLQFASPSDIQLRWNDIPQAQKEELAARYQPSPMQGAMASQYQNPQGQQMQNYNNLLQQGIQRSNTMNQDAASNFANMQAGAPTTQPAVPAKANPAMPIAGLGMQQPRATPAPRKFSTVNTPSARFG